MATSQTYLGNPKPFAGSGHFDEPNRHALQAKGIHTGNLASASLVPMGSSNINPKPQPEKIVIEPFFPVGQDKTPEAQNEIAELEADMKRYRNEESDYRSRGFRYEGDAAMRKWLRIEDKINKLQQLGLSSAQKRSLQYRDDELTLHRDKDIFSSDTEKVAYFPKLKTYAKFKEKKWSSYMSNVRGMGSYADKREINDFKPIPKRVYESIVKSLKEAGTRSTVAFAGAVETTQKGMSRTRGWSSSNVELPDWFER